MTLKSKVAQCSTQEYLKQRFKIFLYNSCIYSTLFPRYFVYDSINPISLWLVLFMWAMLPMGLLFAVSHQLQIALCVVCSLELTDGILMSFSSFSRTDSSNFGRLSFTSTPKGLVIVAARWLVVEIRIGGFDLNRD